jgi:hypothetical protein
MISISHIDCDDVQYVNALISIRCILDVDSNIGEESSVTVGETAITKNFDTDPEIAINALILVIYIQSKPGWNVHDVSESQQ